MGARYRRETEYTDSVGGMRREYFVSGKLHKMGRYDHLRKGVPDGVHETWFENGQLQSHSEFKHGSSVGEFRTYHPNGKLKRCEHNNVNGEFSSTGECFGPDGQSIPFFKFEQMPIYLEGDGGNGGMVAAIMRNLKYPRDAFKARRTGRVLVSFVVTSTGEVAKIKLVQGVYPSLDEAAMQAVRQLNRFVPGKQDGKPVEVSFTVPVKFNIQ